MARCPSLVWIFLSSAGLLCSIITIITTNIFRSCIRAQLPASPNRYPPENCTKIYSRAICLYWVSAGDWCFCCSVQDHSERPPYPGQDNRQSGFVKTVTSLLTDWAMSSCDDIIYDGQCLNTLYRPLILTATNKNPAANIRMKLWPWGKWGGGNKKRTHPAAVCDLTRGSLFPAGHTSRRGNGGQAEWGNIRQYLVKHQL